MLILIIRGMEFFPMPRQAMSCSMSQHLMRGEWGACMRYFVPVIAFALGVFLAERICHRYKYCTENTLETAHSVDRDRDFVCRGFHSAAV